jgi:hypothetical protein
MLNISDNHLISIPLEALENGYFRDEPSQRYTCLFCDASFEEGVIYPFGDLLLVARRAAGRHVVEAHGEVFELLLRLGKQHTGVSEIQQTVLQCVYEGHGDREIAAELGGKSVSTVRNHRFLLRKRQKEAKIFLALMNLLERKGRNNTGFVDFQADIPVKDDRVVVTTEEAQEILNKYFGKGALPKLMSFPRKQKPILVVLNRLAGLFERDRSYSEKEVNQILSAVYSDYVTIRRYLIDYGFLRRKRDGSEYRRT